MNQIIRRKLNRKKDGRFDKHLVKVENPPGL